MVPTNLDRAHHTELVTASSIDRRLVTLNFRSLQATLPTIDCLFHHKYHAIIVVKLSQVGCVDIPTVPKVAGGVMD